MVGCVRGTGTTTYGHLYEPLSEVARTKFVRTAYLVAKSHTEGSFLANAANQVSRYRVWARDLGLFPNVDFAELDAFDQQMIRDLRNMREHVIDYFVGQGNNQDRWFVETPEYSADASSVVGSMIGGRLDYKTFTSACEAVLQRVLAAN